MKKSRRPEPAPDYLRYWTGWWVLVLGTTFIYPTLTADRASFVLMLIGEAVGYVRHGRPDTLSEYMSWIAGWAKADARWWESWNALVTGLVLLLSYKTAFVVSHGYDGVAWSFPVVGGILGLTVFFLLQPHWLRPETKG